MHFALIEDLYADKRNKAFIMLNISWHSYYGIVFRQTEDILVINLPSEILYAI